MPPFFTPNSPTLTQFYQQILSSVVFHNQESFLEQQKFDIDNYMTVLQSQRLVQDVAREVVSRNCEKLSQLRLVASEYLVDKVKGEDETEKLTESIASVIFSRLEQVKSKYVLQAMATGALYLEDINWKVNRVVSSSAKTFVGIKNPYTFHLSLYLNQESQQQTTGIKGNRQLISLEMSKPQLKQFLNQLKKIKGQLNSN